MNKKPEPFVSICCITHNHESYIRDAIEGFLKQVTNFSFEIIIQDDASTDQTADIIREYKIKNPEIINPIFHKENQYSKGVGSIILPPMKIARGKYIALCEGDDYWVDPLKLQKQITDMEKHPGCYLSFHPAIEKWDDGKHEDKILCLYSPKNKIFSTDEVILGGGSFIPSASIVINASVIPRIISFFEIAKEAQVGDYYIQILGSENGGALYLSDVMSVYRKGVLGSCSDKSQKDLKYQSSVVISTINIYKKIDKFTNYKYTKQFAMKREDFISKIVISLAHDNKLKEQIFNAYRYEISVRDIMLWQIIFKHPRIVAVFKQIKSIAH